MFYMGIDIGSTASKAIILNEEKQIATQSIIPLGTGTAGPSRVVEAAYQQAGVRQADINFSVVTGYGRITYQGAEDQVSEITCHAKGVFYLNPSVRTIVDIGGQDIKVIKLNAQGIVTQFVMNDKCAAGTGRFLEVMARVLDIDVDNMGELSRQARSKVMISSTCTVFAESEVISRLSAGETIPDIIAGIHQSVARRIASLCLRVGLEKDVVLTGGVARNCGIVAAIEEELNTKIIIPTIPQFTGALGAALLAWQQGRAG
ncbi:acyl-CoA dehydratase activase [Sporomusa sphaeroides DSM 2875]|uniref:acyl-CoA dehydratase activase n=1 Tax=Sporomusa sphaeroides TaxID=47679 RepID=UPI00202ECECC|nr:acyl-CoA dehydratase activase [Sporomusa sphaeroides]MCM0759496.1 acyl-CoA dehydratase activase [Sporomusa sphaeroides DSM 2875]